MTQQFQEQGGAATMDPNPLVRWLTSTIMTRLSRPQRWVKRRRQSERQRTKAGQPHVVEYFHQVDDGYSHLAAQVLPALAARYEIELVCHLVTGPEGKNVPEPELLLGLSRYDAFHVAPDYGLEFPRHEAAPDPALVKLATTILAAQDADGFIACAAEVGRQLWAGDESGLQALAEQYGAATQAQSDAKIESGTARRHALQHYSGAMFYYGQEWYWGVDRLYHLEKRLAMYEAGLWGVPSFRLLDDKGEQLLALWGQDRLWLFAREIQRQLASRTDRTP